MYKNRAADGALNLCGPKIAQLRQAYTPALSQRALADRLQLCGLETPFSALSADSGLSPTLNCGLWRSFSKFLPISS